MRIPSPRRLILGLIALASLLLSAAFYIWLPTEQAQAFGGGCLKIGVVLGALWLAFDQIDGLPVWLLLAMPGLVLVLVIRPKWFLFILPLVILLVLLRPRASRRS